MTTYVVLNQDILRESASELYNQELIELMLIM